MTDPNLIFGKYALLSRLAIGGMGEVFYAVQRGVAGFERPAILKNLLPDLAQHEGFVDQFLDEARVAATLNHPNVVSIYEVGLWNGTYFIAMEYIQGRNVSQLIRAAHAAKLRIPPLVAVTVIRDAALGLHHAHKATDAQGQPLHIIHRDVSPQNIMVRDDGVTKVVDFGIARAANRATRTQTGSIKGKLAYMPPEQMLGSDDLSAAADQYSLGVVLYEMCTGQRLFKGSSDLELMKLVSTAEVPPLTSAAPGTPEALSDVVQRMMHKDPRQRFESCAQVATELDLVQAHFSPPGRESPVAAFLRPLGPVEPPAPLATPSTPANNFVISLARPADAAAPARDLATRPSAPRAPQGEPAPAPPPQGNRRLPMAIAAVFAALIVVVGAFAALRSKPEPVAPPPPPPPPVVVAPTPVVEAPPTAVPPPAPVPVEPARWKLTTTPAGATVRLDGRPMGTSPVELTVSPGEVHFLLVERAGHRRDERELPGLTAGETKELALTLTPLARAPVAAPPVAAPVAAAQGPGFLTLSTTPWTKVSVAGEALGSTPLFKARLSPGEHTLTLVNEGLNINVTRKVTVRAGEVTKLDLKL